MNNLDSVKLSLEAQILPAGTKPIKIAIGMGAMNRCVLNGTLESLHVLQQLWRLGCDHVLLTGHTPTLVTRVMAEAVGFVPEIQTFNPTNPKLEPNASFNGAVDCIILRRMCAKRSWRLLTGEMVTSSPVHVIYGGRLSCSKGSMVSSLAHIR